jgi:ParB family chromosome partitioning protein
MATRKKPARKRRKKAEAGSRGLSPADVAGPDIPDEVRDLAATVIADGGAVLGCYRDPLGGHWQIFAALPLAKVKPTVFQRNLSDTHMKRLAEKIDRLGRYLDPVIAVRAKDGDYLTPNGYHRLSAMQRLGARSITALLVPEMKIAYQILALNTEKAYNVREKSLEAIRLARELARIDPSAPESDYTAEFEEAPFLTLGACYERKGQFSGGAYMPVLKRTEAFFDDRIGKAIPVREKRADRLFKLDDAVTKAVDALKKRGLKSPYLKTFVVARINPLRWARGAEGDFDETMDKMMDNIRAFDPGKIQQHHLAGMAGPAPEES